MKKIVASFAVLAGLMPLFAAPATANKGLSKAEIIIIESPDYTAGQEDVYLTKGLAQFLGVSPVVTKMTPAQAAADETLSTVEYDFLPFYLVKKTPGVREKFAEPLEVGYLEETDDYILLPHQTRTGVYTAKQGKKDVMELFVMSQCPYGVMAEKAIIQAMKDGSFPKDKEVRIRYIVNYDENRGFTSLHGSGEWEEDVRQLLIAKYYPSKLWKYLEIRNKDYRSSRWDKAMEDAGINVSKISKKFDSEGLELLKAEAAYGDDYAISASPTFLWEGKAILDFGTASQIEGFDFLNPSSPDRKGKVEVPAGSC